MASRDSQLSPGDDSVIPPELTCQLLISSHIIIVLLTDM